MFVEVARRRGRGASVCPLDPSCEALSDPVQAFIADCSNAAEQHLIRNPSQPTYPNQTRRFQSGLLVVPRIGRKDLIKAVYVLM